MLKAGSSVVAQHCVGMWVMVPHALDMLFLWALWYGKSPRSLLLCQEKDRQGPTCQSLFWYGNIFRHILHGVAHLINWLQ